MSQNTGNTGGQKTRRYHASVIATSPEKASQASKVFEESILPMAQTAPGFQGDMQLRPQQGTVLCITYWDSEPSLRKFENSISQQRDQLSRLGSSTTVYQVIANAQLVPA